MLQRFYFVLFLLFISVFCQAQLPTLIPFRSGNNWGYTDSTGAVKIPANYSNTSLFSNGLAIVSYQDKWGVLKSDGSWLISPKYQQLLSFQNGRVLALKAGKWGAVNEAERTLIPFEYERIRPFSHPTVTAMKREGRWGLVDDTGTVVLRAQLDLISDFQGEFAAAKLNETWALIDAKGKTLSPFIFESIVFPHPDSVQVVFQNNTSILHLKNARQLLAKYAFIDVPQKVKSSTLRRVVRIEKDSFITQKFGYIDTANQEVVPSTFDRLDPFSEGMAGFKSGERWGFIDVTGKKVLPARYDDVFPFQEGLALTFQKKRLVFVDQEGRKKIAAQYQHAASFNDGRAAVTNDRNGWGNWGFIDRQGNVVVPLIHKKVLDFENGCAIVCKPSKKQADGVWGVIDTLGKTIVSANYDGVWKDPAGGYVVERKGKIGKVDDRGRKQIPPTFEALFFVDNNLAYAMQNGKFGLIDSFGRTLVKFLYDDCTYLETLDLFKVRKGYKFSLMERNGELLLPFKYDTIEYYDGSEAFIVRKQDKWGFIDMRGEPIGYIHYEDVKPFRNGLAKVLFNDRWGYLDVYQREYFK